MTRAQLERDLGREVELRLFGGTEITGVLRKTGENDFKDDPNLYLPKNYYFVTEKDENGNWSVKGIKWENLYEGQEITKEIYEKLYGALWKLMEYEDTGLTPEEINSLNEFENSNAEKLLLEIAKHKWIPVEERLPENDDYILLSFENFSLPMIGRYEENENGGAFYLGDCNEEDTCSANDLFVNAWMLLPEPFCRDKQNTDECTGE